MHTCADAVRPENAIRPWYWSYSQCRSRDINARHQTQALGKSSIHSQLLNVSQALGVDFLRTGTHVYLYLAIF